MHTLSIKDTLLTTYDFKMKFQYYLGIIRALQSLIYCFVVNWINYKQYCVGLYIYTEFRDIVGKIARNEYLRFEGWILLLLQM